MRWIGLVLAWFFITLPWLLLRTILVYSDRDYWRFLEAASEQHSLPTYWKFVGARRAEETTGRHDRTDEAVWQNIADAASEETEEEIDEEPAFDEDDGDYFEEEEPEPKPKEKPKPKGPTPLEKAEKTLGLKPPYKSIDLKKAYGAKIREAHPDKGGSVEQAQEINAARDFIKKHKGWK